MSLSIQPSAWAPLNASKSEIRLLRLEPAFFFLQLQGSFETRSLNHHPRYDAISHAWGRPGASEIVNVGNSAILIPLSLAHCLRQLRKTDEPRFLWVDAICIAQHDFAERAQQVQLMQQIFSYAVSVRVWLGHGSKELAEGFLLLKGCLESRQYAKSITLSSEQYMALSAMTRADWWDRLWVVQEVALARQLFLHYEDMSIDCSLLKGFLYDLQISHQDVENVSLPPSFSTIWKIHRSPLSSQISTMTQDSRTFIRHLLRIQGLTGLLHDGSTATASAKADILLALFCQNRSLQTTDPRDRIYGVMGICDAFFGDFLNADYTASVSKVYTDFAWQLIKRSGSLAVLNQANSGLKAAASLPSWVPDWNSPHDYSSEYFRMQQYRGNPAFNVLDAVEPRREGDVLVITGLVVDRIRYLTERILQHPNELLETIKEWKAWQGDLFNPDTLGKLVEPAMEPHRFKIISEDNDYISFTATVQFASTGERLEVKKRWNRDESLSNNRQCFLAWILFRGVLMGATNNVNIGISTTFLGSVYEAGELLRMLESELEKTNYFELKGLPRYCAVSVFLGMHQYGLFKSPDGYLGACPAGTRAGDCVAVLDGSRVPIILRKGTVEHGKQRYTIVGEAFLTPLTPSLARWKEMWGGIPSQDIYIE